MANYLKDEKAELMCELLLMGLSIRETARIARISKQTVMIAAREINEYLIADGFEPLKCGCGKETLKHKGWCKDRFERHPKRQKFMKEWQKKRRDGAT